MKYIRFKVAFLHAFIDTTYCVSSQFEERFLTQQSYEMRDIFQSLDIAWSLCRTFPREMLKRISEKILDEYYSREATH